MCGNTDTLNSIMCEKTNEEIEPFTIDEKEYNKQRTVHLTQKIAELIDVCESEFKKDEMYLAKINELTTRIQNLEKENSEILNSNSWKVTKNFRKIGKKFK